MKIEIVGGEDKSEFLSVNSASTTNLFPAKGGDEARYLRNLLPTPGLKQFVELGDDGEIRNLNRDTNFGYVVSGKNFYRLSIDVTSKTAAPTLKGTINSSVGFVSSAVNETQVMIVDGTPDGFIYTTNTDTFTQITDPDFTGGDMVIYTGGYFMYLEPGTARVRATALQDGLTHDALDFTTAEAESDNLVGLAVLNDEAWFLGENVTEIYSKILNPPATGFPYARRAGAFIKQGCSAKGSIQNFDNGLVWLDDRRFIVKNVGNFSVEIISNESVSRQIQDLNVVGDARAMTYAFNGHLFYEITFPTEEKTFVYNARTKGWHFCTSVISPNTITRHLPNTILTFEALKIAGSFQEGKLFLLDGDTFTDDGLYIEKERESQHTHAQGKEFSVEKLFVEIQPGVGVTVGQGDDPLISMQYSRNGGKKYSSKLFRSMGKKGEYFTHITWNRLGRMRTFTVRLRVTDPVPTVIMSADIKGFIVPD